MKKPVIYIAGPYRAATEDGVFSNILAARDAAKTIWESGGVPLCPHLNSMFMGGVVPDSVFLEGDLVLLARCDALYAMASWPASTGASNEIRFARDHDIPVFDANISSECIALSRFIREFTAKDAAANLYPKPPDPPPLGKWREGW